MIGQGASLDSRAAQVSTCCVAPRMPLGFLIYQIIIYQNIYQKILLSLGPQCECVGRTVVASNSSCGIVPLSLAQEFVAEVSPFVKELVANSRSLSYRSLIWRGPGDRMGLCVTVTRHS